MKEIYIKITVDEDVENKELLRDIKELLDPHEEPMIIEEIGPFNCYVV